MSSPSTTPVSSTVASIDSVPVSPDTKEPWLPDQAELGSSQPPWYEDKSSNLRSSDISFIKEKGGMFDSFEVMIPGLNERAHRPPRGFHSFYINQLDMGLRYPLPRFIADLCQHIKISPSQLAPNSYSFLLSLAILLRFHNLPLVPYVLMQLIKIKRLGPGKFYLSHKGDHAFIKGNPSSHKGWMSRFFFVRRVDRKRDPWKCDMSWRDNIFTFTPRTPERSPNLTSFLDAMREKSYNAPELIQEDLLCALGFSRRGVELVGDLDERMGKAELVKAMPEEARASGEVGPPKKAARKRSAVSSAEEEAHREKRKKKGASTWGTRPGESPRMTHEPTPLTRASEETPDLPPIITIPEALSPARGKGPERVIPFDFSKDSLVDSPTGAVATRLICNMVSDRDFPVLKGAEDIEAVGHFAANLTSEMAWGDEVVRRLTRAHRTVKASRKKFDEAMGRHAEMVARLEELEVLRAQDEVVATTQRKELEVELAAEKEARATEKRALGAELERANVRADRVKEDFLKSPEFDYLLAKKAWGYFKDGFWGCLAQFRSNGYSEEEHPAFFLNLQQALENLGDDEDAEDEEEEQEEGEVGDDTEANTPNSPKP
ncbi:hypothetical protein F511_29715 [Dorcoceras hygrometricum]|uniref:Transposase (Putative), gypsy type n=1 Tax=Dorcoceras hygrometricum TaxID=472368 RepID=A0A2Z7CU89_9LAMI|nr:hypothetical protein F511_29715 [Dorcoceras hygrometricum]